MNLTDARTPAVLQFHRFHEHLNRTIKVEVIGLGLLHEAIAQGRSKESFDQLLRNLDWLWGGMPDWTKPNSLIDEARGDIGRDGVMRSFSAFDHFLTGIAAEITSWESRSPDSMARMPIAADQETADDEEKDDDDKVVKFYRWLGADRANIEYLWPIYRYFRVARNCIAHRRGIATAGLAERSTPKKISKALESWPDYLGDFEKPEIVAAYTGVALQFTHRHALTASSILRLIALDINRVALNILGAEGLVHQVARGLFFKDPPVYQIESKISVMRALHRILGSDLAVTELDENETRKMLYDLDLWDVCSRKFQQHLRSAKE